MSDTKNTSTSQGEIEEKAALLLSVLKKHNPNQLKDLSFELMQKHNPASEEHKCFSALYEIMDIFKTN